MRYEIKGPTLVIEGEFEAISSGINGGRMPVNYLINHHVQQDFNHNRPKDYLGKLTDSLIITKPYFGLLTAVSMDNLQVIRNDYLTTFVTAGITHPSGFRIHEVGTINIILVMERNLSEGAMAGAIITATEAKGLALLEMGYDFLGTTTDAVIVAYEKQPADYMDYAGPYTEIGKKITMGVIEGVKQGIN